MQCTIHNAHTRQGLSSPLLISHLILIHCVFVFRNADCLRIDYGSRSRDEDDEFKIHRNNLMYYLQAPVIG